MGAGPIEFSGPELVLIFAVVFLVPPLAFSILATGVHYLVQRQGGGELRPGRTFLLWWGGATAAWIGFLVVGNFLGA